VADARHTQHDTRNTQHATRTSPTFTDTPLVRESPDEVVEGLKRAIGGSLLTPPEVARGVVELATDPGLAGAVMRVTVRGGRDLWQPSTAPSPKAAKSPAAARL
jgi:hypothetical protein